MDSDQLSDDVLVRVGEVLAPVAIHLKCKTLQRHPDGSLTRTYGEPLAFFVEGDPPERIVPRVDPHSILGLEMRGFKVMIGKRPELNRVLIMGAWVRISDAIRHGHI